MLNKSKKLKIFDSDALKNFHKRIFFSIIVFTSFYFIAIFRIADVMIFEIASKQDYKVSEKIERGKIYDRNNQLLSTNINSYSLFAKANKIKNKLVLSEKLSPILNIDSKKIYNKLKNNKKFVYIKRNISPKEHQKIIDIGEINLQTIVENKRIYPYQNSSSHIVGYVDIDNKGQAGVEKGYENILNSGKDIFLTIDINLQNAVRQELIKTIEKFSAESGLCIILDIKKNEILTLNSFPDFNPNNVKSSKSEELLNRPLQSNYEMGSTFKPITIAMGIDYNLIEDGMKFDVTNPIKNTIHDYHPFEGSLGIKEILVRSSNIGTAKIAKKIGKKNQIDFFKKIGFYEPVKTKLLEATNPLGNKNNWGEIETMTIGYGHGFAVTPMHLILAYSSILNGGKKIDIKLLQNEKNRKSNQVISNETSIYINKLLRAVVLETEYTGPRVKIEGYNIGGKTGTAELINSEGKYQEDANRTLFVGAFPMNDPQFLILTVINNPKKIKEENYNITGAAVNAPLVKKIILRMIEILDIPKQKKTDFLNAATTVIYNESHAIN